MDARNPLGRSAEQPAAKDGPALSPTRGQAGRTDYERQFGFRESPFTLTANPRFVFDSRTYAAVIDAVGRSLDRHEPLLVVTGPPGSGKTLVCRTVTGWRDGRTFIAWVPTPPGSASDLLRVVLDEFKVLARDSRRSAAATHFELGRALDQFLVSMGSRGGRAMVLIDDAHRLTKEGLEELRSWMTIETENRKLLQIVLLGEPPLAVMLSDPELTQLGERVTRQRSLDPILPDEVDGYIGHRLSVAQGEQVSVSSVFSKEAIGAIRTLSNRVPRTINLLCDRSLEVAHALERSPVDLNIVIEAARTLNLPIPAGLRIRRQKRKLAAVSALLLPAAIGWSLYAPRGRPELPVQRQAVEQTARPADTATQPVAAVPPAMASADAATTTPAPEPPSATLQPPPADVKAAEPPIAPSPARPPDTAVAAPQPAGASGFNVVASSFATQARALALSGRVSSELGLPVRVRLASGWHQVVVGPYATREEAEGVREQLTAIDVTGALVTSIVPRAASVASSPAPEPTLSVPTLPPPDVSPVVPPPIPDGVDVVEHARNLSAVGDVRSLLQLRDAAEGQLVREGRTADEVRTTLSELDGLIQVARRRRLELDAKALEPPR